MENTLDPIMKRHSRDSRWTTFLATAVCLACSALMMPLEAQTTPGLPAPTAADQAFLKIESGDTLDVHVFNTPELSAPVRVGENGTIVLLVGGSPIHVAGLTADEAGTAIEVDLKSEGIMLDPKVTVTVTNFATQGITVAGEVKSPGIYTLLGQHGLYDLLSAAGGPTQYEGPTITITHKSDPQHPEVLPVHSATFSEAINHVSVYPGDTVFVARAGVVYVVGAVQHSGAFVMQDGAKMTVLTSLALAQGLTPTAALKKAEIVRDSPEGVVVIKINLKDLMKQKTADVALNTNDVLVVPGSAIKDFTMKTLPGITTGVTNAVTYALIYP